MDEKRKQRARAPREGARKEEASVPFCPFPLPRVVTPNHVRPLFPLCAILARLCRPFFPAQDARWPCPQRAHTNQDFSSRFSDLVRQRRKREGHLRQQLGAPGHAMPPIKKNKKGRPPSLHKHLFSLSLFLSLLFSFFFLWTYSRLLMVFCSGRQMVPFFRDTHVPNFSQEKKEETPCAAAPSNLHYQQQQQQNTRSPGAVGRAR